MLLYFKPQTSAQHACCKEEAHFQSVFPQLSTELLTEVMQGTTDFP